MTELRIVPECYVDTKIAEITGRGEIQSSTRLRRCGQSVENIIIKPTCARHY